MTRCFRPLLRYAAALALLAAGGAALCLPAASLRRQQTAAGLQAPPPDFRRTDALGQNLAVFALGGLRSLAAELLALDATNAWLERDWPRARERWQQITTLCPRRVNYWARASRDMSKNAVADIRTREGGDPTERAQLERGYLDDAERFLQEGIANNPNTAYLRLELAAFYEDSARRPQFAKAAEAYRDALAHGADPMYERWVFYNLCRLRGQEAAAYELGRRLFATGKHNTPALRCLLFVLQNKLDLPADQRLSLTQLFGTPERARRELRRFEHNTLRYPTAGVSEALKELK